MMVSKVEQSFIRGDTVEEADGRDWVRADGRRVDEARKLQVDVTRIVALRDGQHGAKSHCEVAIGDTRVLATVSAVAMKPYEDRPGEGVVKVNVTLSPFVKDDAKNLVSSVLEHAILESRAIDLEGLCIVVGRMVWCIQIDISVLNDCGNVIDCGCLAAFGALCHFRRPDVSVIGETVTIYSLDEREPVPLSLHHIPLCVSFALFRREVQDEDKFYYLLDPTDREELSQDGRITICVNVHKEVCAIHKEGWPPLDKEEVSELVSIASKRAIYLSNKLTEI